MGEAPLPGALAGLLALAEGRGADAIQHLGPVAPGDPRLRYAQAIALFCRPGGPAGESLLALLARTETDARVSLLLGLTRRLLGRDDAVDALRTALLDGSPRQRGDTRSRRLVRASTAYSRPSASKVIPISPPGATSKAGCPGAPRPASRPRPRPSRCRSRRLAIVQRDARGVCSSSVAPSVITGTADLAELRARLDDGHAVAAEGLGVSSTPTRPLPLSAM
ncbi:MAG: hypothetical protein R3F43_20940 [bacterium]